MDFEYAAATNTLSKTAGASVIGAYDAAGNYTGDATQTAQLEALLGKFAYYDATGNATLATMWIELMYPHVSAR